MRILVLLALMAGMPNTVAAEEAKAATSDVSQEELVERVNEIAKVIREEKASSRRAKVKWSQSLSNCSANEVCFTQSAPSPNSDSLLQIDQLAAINRSVELLETSVKQTQQQNILLLKLLEDQQKERTAFHNTVLSYLAQVESDLATDEDMQEVVSAAVTREISRRCAELDSSEKPSWCR